MRSFLGIALLLPVVIGFGCEQAAAPAAASPSPPVAPILATPPVPSAAPVRVQESALDAAHEAELDAAAYEQQEATLPRENATEAAVATESPAVERTEPPPVQEDPGIAWVKANCKFFQPESRLAQGECDPVCPPEVRIWPCPEYSCPPKAKAAWVEAANRQACGMASGHASRRAIKISHPDD